ncbi:MAG TPA: TetR family transcriptional regulator [Solirubrobacteraceae bacterium]|nr:TetR family transcriptional regulator [Solirubrobacteraceae bacterium]
MRTADKDGARPRRTQAERRQHTRQALLDAALLQMEAGESFDSLSLRSVARAAGVVPTAFYRYFASMDELGLVLIEDSFRTLRAMLRHAREESVPAERIINRSVEILVSYVRENRQQFAFVARIRSTGNGVLRHAIRAEIRLFISDLATDLARFPVLDRWGTDDLQMLSALLVNTMIATIESLLDAPPDSTETIGEITALAERQMRLVILGVPGWDSDRSRRGPRR